MTNVGVWAVPLYVTEELITNPVPLMVSSCGLEPTGKEGGNSDTIDGTGLPEEPVTVNVKELETAPLASGFVTVTGNAPGVVKAPAGKTAVKLNGVPNVVCSGAPLKLTTAPGTKLEPERVNTRPGASTGVLSGVSVLRPGAASDVRNAPSACAMVLEN